MITCSRVKLLDMAEKRAAVAATAALLLLEALDEVPPAKKPRSCWVSPWLKGRREQGAYENLMRELALDDGEAYRRFIRMDTATFEDLLQRVAPLITKRDTPFRRAIVAGERLAITLRYLATGDSQMSLQYAFYVAHNTISKIVSEVCRALYTVLSQDFLKVPQTHAEWLAVAQGFEELWQFPHCVGALDGKHVVIQPPPQSGAQFRNYKGTFSIVLMALVDAELNFIFVDVGKNGRVNDSGVWMETKLWEELEAKPDYLPPPAPLPHSPTSAPHVIVGDEGFGLKPYLMRPYPVADLEHEKRIFNYRLSRARRTSENAFGVMCSTWQIYRAPLRHLPERARYIVLATVVMHNYLRSRKAARQLYCPSENVDVEDILTGHIRRGAWREQASQCGAILELPKKGSNCSREARNVRDTFRHYFYREGQVSWQWRLITK